MSSPLMARLIRRERDAGENAGARIARLRTIAHEAAAKGNAGAVCRLHLIDLMGDHWTLGDAVADYRTRHEFNNPRAGAP